MSVKDVGALPGLLVVLVSTGCLQQELREWGRDEVTVLGTATLTSGGALESIALDVKNVEGLEDGRYVVEVPRVAADSKIADGADGLAELDGAASVSLVRVGAIPSSDFWVKQYATLNDTAPVRALDETALKAPNWEILAREAKGQGPPGPLPDLGTRLVREGGDDRLEVFTLDLEHRRWIRVVRTPVCRGTQWGAVRTGVVVLLFPVACVLDLVLVPVYFIRNQGEFGCCLGPIPL